MKCADVGTGTEVLGAGQLNRREVSDEDVVAWIGMYNNGVPLKDIVKGSPFSRTTVVSYLKRAGVELRSTKVRVTWSLDEAALMIQEGVSIRDIADKFAVDPATIREGLRRHRPGTWVNSRSAERLHILEQAAKVAEDHDAPDIAAAIRALGDDAA